MSSDCYLQSCDRFIVYCQCVCLINASIHYSLSVQILHHVHGTCICNIKVHVFL